jgi:two-component system sensor histidine kinase/response regulator
MAGLDTADGLRRVLGNQDVYLGLLRRFASSQAQAAIEIRGALTDGRRADAERVAHTLKGVAGSIGARQLQREAGEVEAALRRGASLAEIEPWLTRAEQTLDALVAVLRRETPEETEAPVQRTVIDPSALSAAVARLEQLLSQDAVEAIEAFQATSALFSGAYGERGERIGKLIRSYRFEDALAVLREAVGGSRPEI